MTSRNCPICVNSNSVPELFLEQNIDQNRLTEFSFASRKVPEFMCHKLVRCTNCDLVFVDNPPDQTVLAQAYHISDFDSAEEAEDAARAYTIAVQPILATIPSKNSALEIGTGTGVFLEALQKAGFTNIVGIEPSTAAIEAAPEHRKPWIHESIFRESDFEPESFDLICCFMTLEHVLDPHEILSAASRLLKPEGAIVLVTHNYRSWINRILGRKSPIIDIEHMQLFSPKSIEYLLKTNGFNNISISSFTNRYALRYWLRLLPLDLAKKQKLISVCEALGIADIKIGLNVGNILSYGYRPNK